MNGRKRTHDRQTGFTLVELLVVIGVIVILMTIAVPMIGKGLAYANRTRCSTNLQQLAMGVALYADHNPRNTRNYLPPISTEKVNNWIGAVTNNLQDAGIAEILVCPARANARKSLCYAGHPVLLASGTTRYKPADVKRPDGVIMAGDRPQGSSAGADDSAAAMLFTGDFVTAAKSTVRSEGETVVSAPGRDGSGGTVAFRHRIGGKHAANFAYFDGHVDSSITNEIRRKQLAYSY